MGRECRKDKDFRLRNFPDNIRELLCLLVDEEDNKITLVLHTCEDCVLEDVCLVAVIGNLAVVRYHDKFKFIDIHCICEVIVDCDVILDEILEANNRCKC